MKAVFTQLHDDHDQLIRECYYLNGKLHREDAPAIQEWNHQGQLISEIYYLNGERHRDDGPAFQEWNDQGELVIGRYYLNSKCIHKHEFLVMRWHNVPIELFRN